MLVRSARESDARDIAACIAMAESEMVHYFTGVSDVEQSTPVMMELVLNPCRNRYSLVNCLVAEVEDKVAGTIIAFPADSQTELDAPLLELLQRRGYNLDELYFEGESGTYYLSTMAVYPGYRGQGIGGALMKAAEMAGGRLGFSQASLLVSKGKEKAKALYERLGFTVHDEAVIVDVEYYRMIKNISPEYCVII